MSAIIIKLQGLADGRPTTVDGQYLRYCDFDAAEGRGVIYGTADPHQALMFADVEDALAYWKQQSSLLPLRPDGRPNRPLTSYTVSLEKYPE